jgi:hypothetical protein
MIDVNEMRELDIALHQLTGADAIYQGQYRVATILGCIPKFAS